MSRRVSIFGSSFASNVYLFDDPTIAAGIAAPFALFRLKTAYTGPIVDVRRTVGATTTIVSVGLGSGSQFTLDAPVTGVVTGASTATNLGEFVNASGYANPDGLPAAQDWFYSKGYNQNNGAQVWVQATATQQPRGGTSGVMAIRNSRAEMVFDGSNDFCSFGLVSGPNKPSNFSVIAVGAWDNLTLSRLMCGTSNSGGANTSTWGGFAHRTIFPNRVGISYSVTGVSEFYGHTTAQVITLGQQMMMENYKQAGVARGTLYTDGASRAITDWFGTGVENSGASNNYSVGRAGDLGSNYFLGGVQFVGIWTTHKESDRLAIKAKINAMLGTTW